jgi:hypothetical protein
VEFSSTRRIENAWAANGYQPSAPAWPGWFRGADKVPAQGFGARLQREREGLGLDVPSPPYAQSAGDFAPGKALDIKMEHLLMPEYCSRTADGFSGFCTMLPSAFEARGGPLSDHVTFQLRHSGDHCEHGATHRGGGV